jgi:hypothetical protein
MVAALADPKGVAVLRNDGGVLTAIPLLTSTLPADTPNSVRKLFQVNRVETIAAVMHEFVMVPEGRTDYEWLGLLGRAVDLHQSWAAADECRFDAFVGVIPTHDGCRQDGRGQGAVASPRCGDDGRRGRGGRRIRRNSCGGRISKLGRDPSVGGWPDA